MNRFPVLLKYELFNVLRGRWLILYALLFAGFGEALLQFGADPVKAVVSLMSVTLLVIPLVSVLYASVYWYSAEGFTSLLLTQPVRRDGMYVARWLAISSALSSAFVMGGALPLALNGALDSHAGLLLGLGVCLTFIFTGLGLLCSVWITDRMKGLGAAFTIWFYFSIVHDGLVFLFMATFHEYPMELPSMLLAAANPIDLVRILLLLAMDYAALMGYTGAVLQKVLSGSAAQALLAGALAFWLGVPLWAGIRRFRRRDF